MKTRFVFLISVIWNDSIGGSYTVPAALCKIQPPTKYIEFHVLLCTLYVNKAHPACKSFKKKLPLLLMWMSRKCVLTIVYKHAEYIFLMLK